MNELPLGPPFERTRCACETCRQCCREQPGPLAPGDLERIAAHLGQTVDQVRQWFWASPGAVLMDQRTGRMRRVGTITPQRRHGRCVFLSDEGWCRIHEVAPFGCAYYDTHMPDDEANRRSTWLYRRIEGNAAYHLLRRMLPLATSWMPRLTGGQ